MYHAQQHIYTTQTVMFPNRAKNYNQHILSCIAVHTFDFSFLHTRRPNGVGHTARIVSNDINKTVIDGECVVVCGGGSVHQSLCE